MLLSAAVIAVALAVTAFNAAAAPRSATTPDAIAVAFTDEVGARQTTPYFDVHGAYPGMKAQARTVVLSNGGTVPVVYDLAVVMSATARRPSIADVIVVTILAEDGDAVLYRGPLADVRVTGARPIAPGDNVAHEVIIKWPDGGASDNKYMGKTSNFEFKARARAAA